MASQQNDSATIAITVNGQPREVSSGVTVADLLDAMGIAGERVAVERNRGIVRRADRSQCALAQGDRIEIVGFVGGG